MWFLQEMIGKAGYADLGLANLNALYRLWSTGFSLVVWYLPLG